MSKKLSILAFGLSIAIPCAFAGTVSLSLHETGVTGSLTASSNTGLVDITSTGYGDFQVNNVTGVGSPIYQTPDLNLNTVDVSAATLTSAKTLTIELTETGLSGVSNPYNFSNAFSAVLKGVTSETITTYTDPGDTAFATTDQVATTTFTTQGANSYNAKKSAPTGSPFSETIIITAVFGPTTGTADSLDSNVLMGAAIPEPASLALIGVGLLGLALAGKRGLRK